MKTVVKWVKFISPGDSGTNTLQSAISHHILSFGKMVLIEKSFVLSYEVVGRLDQVDNINYGNVGKVLKSTSEKR